MDRLPAGASLPVLDVPAEEASAGEESRLAFSAPAANKDPTCTEEKNRREH